ncbi:MAG: WD40 repeat domain-containing protein [Proteobacteria bacterium]|nr:WD40 repeat domain-containing protein [Pseudomonadota bacterium]NBP14520.1 WD40 repeat domain-containing protein [bacterium]
MFGSLLVFCCTVALPAEEDTKRINLLFGEWEMQLPVTVAEQFGLFDVFTATEFFATDESSIKLPEDMVDPLSLDRLEALIELQDPEKFLEVINRYRLRCLVDLYNTAAFCCIKEQNCNGTKFDPLELICQTFYTKFFNSLKNRKIDLYHQKVIRDIYNIQEDRPTAPETCTAIDKNLGDLKRRLIGQLYQRTPWVSTQSITDQGPFAGPITCSNNAELVLAPLSDGSLRVLSFAQGPKPNSRGPSFVMSVLSPIASLVENIFSPGFSDEELNLLKSGLRPGKHITDIPCSKVQSVKFSLNGNRVAVILNDGKVQVWNITGSTVLKTEVKNGFQVEVIGFLGDQGEEVLTFGRDDTVKRWNAETGLIINSFLVTQNTRKGYFSPAGNLFARAGNAFEQVAFWDNKTGQSMGSLPTNTRNNAVLIFSPDEKTLAIALPDGCLQLWNISTKKMLWSIPFQKVYGPIAYEKRLKFLPKRDLLVFGKLYGPMQFFDTRTGKLVKEVDSPVDELESIEPVGSEKIVIASSAGTILLCQCPFAAQKLSLQDLEKMPIEKVAALYMQQKKL